MKLYSVLLCAFVAAFNLFSLDYSLENALDFEDVASIVVIGSGPAGYTAALYGQRGGFKTYLIMGNQHGGQLMGSNRVENVPGFGCKSGPDIMSNLKKHVEAAGVVMLADSVSEVNFRVWPFIISTERKVVIRALSVIIATGSTPKLLGIPGEHTYFGSGVSTCADCDNVFFEGQDVAVVGGGDSAIVYALLLAPFAKTVTILNRTGSMRAAPSVLKHIEEYENISVIKNKKVVEVCGSEDSVTHLILEDTRFGTPNKLDVQGMFLAIGHTPNADIFKEYLDVNQHGHIQLNGRTQQTSVPGVFAAGEVTIDNYRQAIVAEGDGAKAGMDAVEFLHGIGLGDKVKRQLREFVPAPEMILQEDELDEIHENGCL